MYALDAFKSGIQDLQSRYFQINPRFYDSSNPKFLLKHIYHKGIPADGFPHFAESIWEKIVTNRDLDLPTQQQLLAQYRCDEISKTVYKSFTASIAVFKGQLDGGHIVEHLGRDIGLILEESLKSFDVDASRYNSQVYQSSRAEFATRMYIAVHIYYVMQMRNSYKNCLVLFEKSISVRSFNFRRNLETTMMISQ